MSMLKKAAVAFAAASMIASPIAASAAPVADIRAASAIEESSEAVSLPLILLGLVAVIGLIVIVSDDDSPSSP